MKVYIVTTGEFDDYEIKKVFIKKEMAENYAEWLEDSNDVKEFEVVDDIQFNKRYKLYASLNLYRDGKVKFSFNICKCMDEDFESISFNNYPSRIQISIYRTLNEEVIDELSYKRKYEKKLNNILAIVNEKLRNGYDEKEINELLRSSKMDYI